LKGSVDISSVFILLIFIVDEQVGLVINVLQKHHHQVGLRHLLFAELYSHLQLFMDFDHVLLQELRVFVKVLHPI
jgi:hypothetical protein